MEKAKKQVEAAYEARTKTLERVGSNTLTKSFEEVQTRCSLLEEEKKAVEEELIDVKSDRDLVQC